LDIFLEEEGQNILMVLCLQSLGGKSNREEDQDIED